MLTVSQLEELGLSPRAARHRMTTGRLARLHHGIYSIGQPTAEGRWMAAVLACGPGTVLSHRSAAALWDLQPDAANVVDVTVRTTTGRARAGIRAHRASSLTAADVGKCRRIPCTALPRTLLDLATVVDRRSLERAVDRAEELRVFDLRAVETLLARSRGDRGTRVLATVLDAYESPTITRSHAEERFLALVESAGLSPPLANSWIALDDGVGYSPDFLWRDARLIVEVDGRAHHARRGAFRHDRRRDRRLALAGYETRRYAASEVLKEPERVADELRAFLTLG